MLCLLFLKRRGRPSVFVLRGNGLAVLLFFQHFQSKAHSLDHKGGEQVVCPMYGFFHLGQQIVGKADGFETCFEI